MHNQQINLLPTDIPLGNKGGLWGGNLVHGPSNVCPCAFYKPYKQGSLAQMNILDAGQNMQDIWLCTQHLKITMNHIKLHNSFVLFF